MLQSRGATIYVPPENRVESILNALNMLQLRRLVRESEGIYRLVPAETELLAYYANAVAHWLQPPTAPHDDSVKKTAGVI